MTLGIKTIIIYNKINDSGILLAMLKINIAETGFMEERDRNLSGFFFIWDKK